VNRSDEAGGDRRAAIEAVDARCFEEPKAERLDLPPLYWLVCSQSYKKGIKMRANCQHRMQNRKARKLFVV
jgi:hypothetical protein